jgi:hypothetical protein
MSHESIPFSTAVSNCRIDATHRKGRIEKWQPRKQPRSQQRKPKSPPRRPRKRSNGLNKTKGNTLGGRSKAFPLVFGAEKKSALQEMTMRRMAKSLKAALGKAIRGIQRNHKVGARFRVTL